jgi:Ca2+-binding RTX toxin-like protein
MPTKQAKHRATGNVRRLIAISAAIGLFIPVLSAVAKQCQPGTDCVGTDGSDNLYGTADKDQMFGRGGDDLLAGRDGPDRLYGGGGDDRLNGKDGRDKLYGSAGGDLLIAGNQPDEQGEIVDKLYGGRGADELHADSDDDWTWGGRGNDTLYGSEFHDLMVGGPGNDRLLGGKKVDLYYLRFGGAADWGHDFIVNKSGFGDVLILPYTRKNPQDILVNLTPSPDRPEVKLVGGGATINWRGNAIRQVNDGRGDDTIRGNDEKNWIDIHKGLDRVFAGGGDDYISALDGNEGDTDKIDCGPGDKDRVKHYAEDDVAANCEYPLVVN